MTLAQKGGGGGGAGGGGGRLVRGGGGGGRLAAGGSAAEVAAAPSAAAAARPQPSFSGSGGGRSARRSAASGGARSGTPPSFKGEVAVADPAPCLRSMAAGGRLSRQVRRSGRLLRGVSRSLTRDRGMGPGGRGFTTSPGGSQASPGGTRLTPRSFNGKVALGSEPAGSGPSNYERSWMERLRVFGPRARVSERSVRQVERPFADIARRAPARVTPRRRQKDSHRSSSARSGLTSPARASGAVKGGSSNGIPLGRSSTATGATTNGASGAKGTLSPIARGTSAGKSSSNAGKLAPLGSAGEHRRR